MTLVAAISALRHDSGIWDDVSAVTSRAAQDAQALTLGESELSWASNPTGLLQTYAEIQFKVATLLGEATKVYTDLSTALDKVAYAYQLNDEAAAKRLKGVWEVHD